MLGPWVAGATAVGLLLAWALQRPPASLKTKRVVGEPLRCCELRGISLDYGRSDRDWRSAPPALLF